MINVDQNYPHFEIGKELRELHVKVRNYAGGEPGQFNFVFPIMRIIGMIKIIS
jgi:hypothetical protein